MIPKFRAWDKINQEMIDVASIHIKAEMVIASNLHFYPFKDIEFVRPTGLKDMHGDEVYQGDIIYDDHNDEYGVVVFDEAKFVIRWQDGYVEDLFERIDLLEVVGNTHENPGLLEENEG